MKFFCLILIVFIVTVGCAKRNTNVTQTVDYYGQHYQECLKNARSKTEYTHTTMHEETLGIAINNCMREYGWATTDEKELF